MTREKIAGLLSIQAGWCRRLDSPLYGALLEQAAQDVRAGGPVFEVLERFESDPPESALALRLMGSVHRLVLLGEAPELARFFPSVGGDADPDAAWPVFRTVVERHRDALIDLVMRPVQTNEVGRSAALLGGFLRVAARTGLPLRLLELGAAAGLQLRWDRYRYVTKDWCFGPVESPVVLRDRFAGEPPPLDAKPVVLDRRGCDLHPVDPTSENGRVTLMSYLWADQTERLEICRGALAIARRVPAVVEQMGALEWLAKELASPPPGSANVVFQSIVMQYLPPENRERLVEELEKAGRRATRASPLAWLRMEPGGVQAEVRLSLWPGGEEELLATSGFHGRPVQWVAESRPPARGGL